MSRRLVAAAALIGLLAGVAPALGQDVSARGLGGEVDVSDLMGFAGGRGRPQQADADSGLDPGQRRKRMTACVRLARIKLESNPDEVEAAVGSLMMQSEAAPAQQGMEFTEEQATNQYVFGMTMSCYQNIDAEMVNHVMEGHQISKADEELVLSQASAPPRPTRKQFLLLESVMMDEQARRMEDLGPDELPGGMHIPGQGMSTRAKLLYVLVVIALLAAAGFWFLPRLFQAKPPRERTAKARRKVLKAELGRLEKTLEKRR